MTDTKDQEQIESVVRAFDRTIVQLLAKRVPAAVVVSTLHAAAVTELAAIMGGEEAARLARNAADHVERLPPIGLSQLAISPTSGRA